MPDKGIGIAKAPADDLIVGNPIDALLPPDRVAALARMPLDKRREFYGSVVHAMFTSPSYQRLVFDVASREFDRMNASPSVSSPDIRDIVEDVVASALKSRGIG